MSISPNRLPYVFCFSGGRSSAYALYIMREELTKDDVIIFNNTGREKEQTLVFVQKCAQEWGLDIVWLEYDYDFERQKRLFKIVNFETAARDGQPFELLLTVRQHRYLPNRTARYCTENLKIVTTEKYLKSIGLSDHEKVLGMRYDEPERYHKNKDTAYMPLYDFKITKPMVRKFWASMPFDLGLKDYEGNCDLCPLKGKNKKLTILEENPEVAKWWIAQEEASPTGWQFDKNYTVTQLLELSQRPFRKAVDFLEDGQTELFDDSIACFCGD
jgi:3'-phosphoadenosine 5'-phosphosulfate sulfotransferase (PAPS reductase)/FAD synthetase